MSASSSRIMIAPVDGSRPLSDRFIDGLLGWWDVGGGRWMRRTVRGAFAACGTKLRAASAPLMERPLIAKSVTGTKAGLTATRVWLVKAFANDVPASMPRHEELHADDTSDTSDTPASDTSSTPHVGAKPPKEAQRLPTRSATAEIRTHTRADTAELRTPNRNGTAELRPRTAPSITRSTLTPVSSTQQTTAMTTNLRCWSCLQRNRVRTPRRGGCFLCSSCNTTMLVVDPIVGLTCDVSLAQTKGICLNRQADETDPG